MVTPLPYASQNKPKPKTGGTKVWKGMLDESSDGGVPSYMVAIKTSKEVKGEGAEEMLREATVMAQVSGHPNLVSLIGAVTSGAPLMLLISLCAHGSLLSVLKKRKEEASAPGVGAKLPFTEFERIKMAREIGAGMSHLTKCKFVHRDLASRNVLVDVLNICKVADFGLARGIAGARAGPSAEDGDEEEYYRSLTGTFPVRWTSPEAMQTMRFSEATDVWSFAITVLEIYTDGEKPYAGMANAAVISQVQGGHRAQQPELCDDKVYAKLLECWAASPSNRPNFADLVSFFSKLHSEVKRRATLCVSSSDYRPARGSMVSAKRSGEPAGSNEYSDFGFDGVQEEHASAVAESGDGYLQPSAAASPRRESKEDGLGDGDGKPAHLTGAGMGGQGGAVNSRKESQISFMMPDGYNTADNSIARSASLVDETHETNAYVGDTWVDDEYLSVAAGLHNGTSDDGFDSGGAIDW